MSTSKLEIRDGKFLVQKRIDYPDRWDSDYVVVEDTFIENINGWTCFVSHAGKIICECERGYSDGINTIRYVIKPNGFASLVFVDPSGRKEVRKQGFVVPKGQRNKPLNGIIGLSGGNVRTRYAYFRDAEFQAFLRKHGITAVAHENPNQRFSAPSIYCGGGNAYQKAWSDGQVRWDYEDEEWFRKACEEPGGNPNLYIGTSYHSVSNATWAVVESYCWYGNRRNYARILYTEVKDVMSLDGSLTERLPDD